ncbi:hypothetical protein [Pseudoroseomonas cervicalis]|uniref:hypothetical protein n=1 Tax=Teichococcus cervicalis TaxID=204525 RepID=UPI0022F19410|nr:hypothetical protein [Pseudoroseomonas cervicalis]WBV44553.1 hypothetical protein PFY06_08355 [Pseudoroseomonas cervicalis]
MAEASASAIAEAALAALLGALPSLATRLGTAEAAHFIAALLPALREEPALSVRVAPALVEGVASRFAGLPVAIDADPALEPGDAVLRWQGGEATRSAAAARAAVARALADCGLLPAASGPAASDTAQT